MTITSVRDALYTQLLEVDEFTGENVSKHGFQDLNKGLVRFVVIRYAGHEDERLTFTRIERTVTLELDLFEKASTPQLIEEQAMIDIEALSLQVARFPHLGTDTIREALMIDGADTAEEVVIGSSRYFKYLLTVTAIEEFNPGYQE